MPEDWAFYERFINKEFDEDFVPNWSKALNVPDETIRRALCLAIFQSSESMTAGSRPDREINKEIHDLQDLCRQVQQRASALICDWRTGFLPTGGIDQDLHDLQCAAERISAHTTVKHGRAKSGPKQKRAAQRVIAVLVALIDNLPRGNIDATQDRIQGLGVDFVEAVLVVLSDDPPARESVYKYMGRAEKRYGNEIEKNWLELREDITLT